MSRNLDAAIQKIDNELVKVAKRINSLQFEIDGLDETRIALEKARKELTSVGGTPS